MNILHTNYIRLNMSAMIVLVIIMYHINVNANCNLKKYIFKKLIILLSWYKNIN